MGIGLIGIGVIGIGFVGTGLVWQACGCLDHKISCLCGIWARLAVAHLARKSLRNAKGANHWGMG